MRKLLTSVILGLLVTNLFSADMNVIKKEMQTIEKQGIKSKAEFEKYQKLLNEWAEKSLNGKMLDSNTKFVYLKVKNGTIEIYKKIYVTDNVIKNLEKNFNKKFTSQKEKEKIVKYMSKLIGYKDISDECNRLIKFNYYKYGGKIKEIIKLSGNYNEKFIIKADNPKECFRVKKTFQEKMNEFINFIKKLPTK